MEDSHSRFCWTGILSGITDEQTGEVIHGFDNPEPPSPPKNVTPKFRWIIFGARYDPSMNRHSACFGSQRNGKWGFRR